MFHQESQCLDNSEDDEIRINGSVNSDRGSITGLLIKEVHCHKIENQHFNETLLLKL